MSYPVPENEIDRLKCLNEYNILDTLPEKEYDDITKLAAKICDTPIALISLVDEKRQWWKSKVGVNGNETPRDQAFCGYTILQKTPFIVTDATKDERFSVNPLVVGHPDIRFYAGTQLKSGDKNLGSLCVIDQKPRQLDAHQMECLQILANHVMILLEHHKYKLVVNTKLQELQILHDQNVVDKSVNAMKSMLLTNISHEIRTPLNGIVATAEALQDIKLDLEHKNLLRLLQTSADDLVYTFTNFMDLAQTDSIMLHKESFFLKQRLSIVVDNYSQKFTEKIINFIFDLPKDEIAVNTDALHLQTVLSNLLSNAVKFTPTGGNVHAHFEITKNETGKVILYATISDDGIGIPESNYRDIFNRMTQLDMSSKKSYKGTGNGLAVCKMITEAFGGSIDFKSEVGKGTIFTVVLPMDISTENEVVLKSVPLRSVLVVDDNAVNRIIACKLIKKMCKNVSIDNAVNGQEAIEKVVNLKNFYDVVLMDLQMPVKDGFEATEHIRKFHGDLPIMALTASTENSDSMKCLQLGMNAILNKPITIEALKKCLSRYFDLEGV